MEHYRQTFRCLGCEEKLTYYTHDPLLKIRGSLFCGIECEHGYNMTKEDNDRPSPHSIDHPMFYPGQYIYILRKGKISHEIVHCINKDDKGFVYTVETQEGHIYCDSVREDVMFDTLRNLVLDLEKQATDWEND